MSHKPLVVVIEGTDDYDAATTLAHLAPTADELRIRCLDNTQALSRISEVALVITSSQLEDWHTISPNEVLALDPASLVDLAKRPASPTGISQSEHQTPSTSTSGEQQGVSTGFACIEHDDVSGLTELPLGTEWLSTAPALHLDTTPRAIKTLAIGSSKRAEDPNKIDSATGDLPVSDCSSSLHPTQSVDTTPVTPTAGCWMIPVLGIDPGLTAQVSCILAQLAAERQATVLMELDRHGFQRFLHDFPLETPSFDAFTNSASAESIIDFSLPVPSRGYRLLPRLPRSHLAHEAEPDWIEALLERLAESSATIVTPIDAVIATSKPPQQTEATNLLAESLLRYSKVMVFVASGGLVPTFALVNLIRESLRRFTDASEILVIITGTRDELRRGRDMHQLLTEAIPESIARLATLEIVTLGSLALDEFHERVLPFPTAVLRALRPFGKRVTQLPPIIPDLHAQVISHPFYESVDPLLNFFSKVQG
jgi:hypothetical protein